MKTYTTTQSQEFTVNYANAMFSGHGHNKIEVEINADNEYKTFFATTTNLEAVDETKKLEGQERYEALFEIVDCWQLDDKISEWIYSLYDNN
jgi:hypothetical protein